MKKNKTIFPVLAGVASIGIFSILGVFIYYKYKNPIGYKNSEICETIEKGITVSEIIKILGDPIYETNTNKENWLYFETLSIRAGPIRARVNKNENRVLILRCFENGDDTWNMLTK